MMLKRREKRRYIAVMHEGSAQDAVALIAKRYGYIYGTAQVPSIKLTRSYDGATIVRCSLQAADGVLVAIALADQPMVTLDMSSSTKRLKRRLPVKVNTAGGEIHPRE